MRAFFLIMVTLLLSLSIQAQTKASLRTIVIKEKAEEAKLATPAKKKERDEFKEKPAQW